MHSFHDALVSFAERRVITMINNGVASEYEWSKFNPMTCTIQELTTYWKQYTLSEPIWNEVREEIYQQGRADALDIDMDEPMHFTDEQKAWIKKYIILNAKRQRADTIDECIEALGNDIWDIAKLEQLKEQKNG